MPSLDALGVIPIAIWFTYLIVKGLIWASERDDNDNLR